MDIIENQRTSGPVNAHLTPGPGIYFIHVYEGQSESSWTICIACKLFDAIR